MLHVLSGKLGDYVGKNASSSGLVAGNVEHEVLPPHGQWSSSLMRCTGELAMPTTYRYCQSGNSGATMMHEGSAMGWSCGADSRWPHCVWGGT